MPPLSHISPLGWVTIALGSLVTLWIAHRAPKPVDKLLCDIGVASNIAALATLCIEACIALIGAAIILTIAGVGLTPILSLIGLLFVSLTLAAKDLISNILAGVTLLYEGHFLPGDRVRVNDDDATLLEIGARTVHLITDSHDDRYITCSAFAAADVIRYRQKPQTSVPTSGETINDGS